MTFFLVSSKRLVTALHATLISLSFRFTFQDLLVRLLLTFLFQLKVLDDVLH